MQARLFTFEKYKNVIILILMGMLGLIVIISTAFVAWSLVDKLILHFDETEFQTIVIELFGLFFLVLVGIELLETLKIYTTEQVVHVEIVLLVSLIVAARKIIVLDYTKVSVDIFFGIAAILIAIGVSYYLLKRASTTTKKHSR
ncbi:MAG: phosphate-starvation-inducible PsiE family protein [Candidatus Thermoplasmatota archaeon]|nr:phosphate-starvation-inducible PsiE family protein [Candidatus Thermoplasmatota archaeon]